MGESWFPAAEDASSYYCHGKNEPFRQKDHWQIGLWKVWGNGFEKNSLDADGAMTFPSESLRPIDRETTLEIYCNVFLKSRFLFLFWYSGKPEKYGRERHGCRFSSSPTTLGCKSSKRKDWRCYFLRLAMWAYYSRHGT